MSCKAEGSGDWRFDAEVHIWEVAHMLPAGISPDAFWKAIRDFAVGQLGLVEHPLPAMSGERAAFHFLAWLRERGVVGQMQSPELSKFYALFCEQSKCAPTPENMMRANLAEMGGVRKLKEDFKSHGRRHRPAVWIIETGDFE